MKKYLEKNTLKTLLFFVIGFFITGLNPSFEKFLASIIINLQIYYYWTLYIFLVILFVFSFKYFKKNAIRYRFVDNDNLFLKKVIILTLLGLSLGILISLLNIYIIGIFQLVIL